MRIASALVSAILLVSTVAVSPAAAQSAGTRVRLAVAGRDAEYGRLVALTPDSVRIADSTGAERSYARGELSRLDLSIGRRHRVGRAIVRGALVGTGIGLVLGAIASGENSGYGSPCEGAGCVALGGAGGAMWGVMIGALVGGLSGSEAWQPLGGTPVRPRIDAASGRVGLAIRF
jgi:hypothetical protein